MSKYSTLIKGLACCEERNCTDCPYLDHKWCQDTLLRAARLAITELDKEE